MSPRRLATRAIWTTGAHPIGSADCNAPCDIVHNIMKHWLALITASPARKSAVRMRIWRGTKALGCALLRDGVYLLPASKSREAALRELAAAATLAGGSGYVLRFASSDPEQEQAFLALFDRSPDYAKLIDAIQTFRSTLETLVHSQIARNIKSLQSSLQELVEIDFFPGAAAKEARHALIEAEREAAALALVPAEQATASAIPVLSRTQYEGRTWATRARPWIDRLASAWLILRFIDPQATFVWLTDPRDCPHDALGFDFNGAAFTHVQDWVTFEVLLKSFALIDDPALSRIAACVHFLDVGGAATTDAGGLETILKGLRSRSAGDDAFLQEALPTFDALYAAYSNI